MMVSPKIVTVPATFLPFSPANVPVTDIMAASDALMVGMGDMDASAPEPEPAGELQPARAAVSRSAAEVEARRVLVRMRVPFVVIWVGCHVVRHLCQ
ncbi:hypothetical protein GCM10009806_25830 [Microbacterium flavum]